MVEPCSPGDKHWQTILPDHGILCITLLQAGIRFHMSHEDTTIVDKNRWWNIVIWQGQGICIVASCMAQLHDGPVSQPEATSIDLNEYGESNDIIMVYPQAWHQMEEAWLAVICDWLNLFGLSLFWKLEVP